MKSVLMVVALAGTAHAAKVTDVTPTTVYIDAGTADGLRIGASWQATIGGHPATVHVLAAATHDAVLQVDGATLAIGTQIDLPPGAAPPPPVTPLPAPQPLPPWRPAPQAIADVQAAAQHQQPPSEARAAEVVVTGELALSVFLAGDLSKGSTSYNDVALASQLSVINGSWRYDHIVEAQLAGSPELFTAPLQHAQAQLDIYLLRLAYTDPRFAAAIGRLPAAPLAEFGTVDGANGSVKLGSGVDATAFAGTRPATDLGLALIPQAGVDVGWQTATPGGTHARVDGGLLVDEYKGSLDRAAVAASGTLASSTLTLHGDTVIDLSNDAFGKKSYLTRADGYVRNRRGKLTLGLSGGYDRPFLDRAYVAELPDFAVGPRTFVGGEVDYALRSDLTLSSTLRGATGDGISSGYGDVQAYWAKPSLRVTVAPHVIVGDLVDEVGLRGGVGLPYWRGTADLLGSFDRVWANGENAWAGLARAAYSLPFRRRWRTMVAVEIAAGDGPPRLFVFATLGYRL